MISGGVPTRIGPLLGSLPIHPSSVSARYHISASFSLILHCQRLELVTESVTKPGYSLEIATGTKNAAQVHSPRINGRISRAWTGYGAPPLSSPCSSPKDFSWRVTEGRVGQGPPGSTNFQKSAHHSTS